MFTFIIVLLAATAVITLPDYRAARLCRRNDLSSGQKHCRPQPKVGLPYEEARIPTDDGESLGAWFIRVREGRAGSGLTLLFHGNAGNISTAWIPSPSSTSSALMC